MMKNALVKSIFFGEKLRVLHEKQRRYEALSAQPEICDYQLERFNEIWGEACRNIPFYREWRLRHSLPARINSLSELDSFPVLTKRDIQEAKELIFKDLPNSPVISTGGSSGEPAVFPTSRGEGDQVYGNVYLGRGWWGIEPLDDILLFWGHSHLFGTGWKGKLNQLKRTLGDWLINTSRYNAYDMSVRTLGRYYEVLKRSNPNLIMGYTSTIYKLAKYIREHKLDIGEKVELKGVIVTSESVTDYDVELIESVFGVPCIIEYGMAETGVIAYSKGQSDQLNIFWDSFIARTDETNVLLVSTLYPRVFPLINYRTDDVVEIFEEYQGSIRSVSKIAGRKKDILCVKSTKGELIELSGILMVHLLKGYPNIYEIVFRQLDDDVVKIKYTSDVDVDTRQVAEYFLGNIRIDHPDINEQSFIFERVEHIAKTIAGKAKVVEK